MPRYIRTIKEIDGINKKIILEVDKCNYCPLIKFHKDKCVATCRKYTSIQDNILDDYVVNYNIDTDEIFDDIKIPDWCGLAFDKSQIDFDTNTYIVKDNMLLTKSDDIESDLEVVNALELLNNRKTNKDDLISDNLPSLIARNYLMSNDIIEEEYYTSYENEIHNYVNTQKNVHICSLCGEEDSSVNRNDNLGMCNTCNQLSEDNKKRKNEAFINNFRLKRGKNIELKKYKLLDTV